MPDLAMRPVGSPSAISLDSLWRLVVVADMRLSWRGLAVEDELNCWVLVGGMTSR